MPNIDKILAQQKAFTAWMAELPDPKRMTRGEIDQMVCDKLKVGDDDYHPDTMTQWIYRLKERLGVVVDFSDDEDDGEDSDDDVDVHSYFGPHIYHKWWEHRSPLIVKMREENLLILKDDGSHKWRYMTNLQLNGEDKKDWEFIIRNMDETTELQLTWTPFQKSGGESISLLHLQSGTTSTRMELSEADSKALSESVRKLMTHPEDISVPRERTITELGEEVPRRYTVTEQIYASRFLNFDGAEHSD